MAYRILTDTAASLTPEEAQEIQVTVVPMVLNFRGKTVLNPTNEETKEFYDAMRAGEPATTAAANPEDWRTYIEPVLQAGEDVLVLAFSSGLSTTAQSAVMAAAELAEKYPDRKVLVVDTLCACRGEGMLVWYAAKKRDAGMSIEEVRDWAENNKLHLSHWFTVDDLKYLKRGGRISAATALMGTMLNIKPILHVDDEGHLISMSKARGRKASMDAILAKADETADKEALSELAFICHGDCPKDAEYLAEKLKEKYGTKEIHIGYTSALIGAHSGPGTLALFFLASHR